MMTTYRLRIVVACAIVATIGCGRDPQEASRKANRVDGTGRPAERRSPPGEIVIDRDFSNGRPDRTRDSRLDDAIESYDRDDAVPPGRSTPSGDDLSF